MKLILTFWLDHAQPLCHEITSLFVFSGSVVAFVVAGVIYGYGVSNVCVVVAGCVFAVVVAVAVAGGIPLPIEDVFFSWWWHFLCSNCH